MQRYPREQGVYKEISYEERVEEYGYQDETAYNRHAMRPHNQFDHINNKHHGYGPHNGHGLDEHGRFSMQYYEEERRADAWNRRNDYNALGGRHKYNGNNGGMHHNEHGVPQGQYGPYRDQQHYQYSDCSERNKKVPAWAFKSITE